ncbi:MAG TPA: cobalamin-dependent protein [Chitinophagaceae bacterium]|nr:cobalamin-dependent protein [Chitinophagaceae bacterium]
MLTTEKLFNHLLARKGVAGLHSNEKETCIRDIDFIMQYLQQQPEQFINLCRWQYLFLQIIKREDELIDILNDFVFFKNEIEPEQFELIQLALQMIKNEKLFLSGSSGDILQFHSRLFSMVDKAAEEKYLAKGESDLEWILKFFDRAQQEKSQVHLDFIHWHQHLLEALGFHQISLIRFLVSVKLFCDERYHLLIDESVTSLLQSFKQSYTVNDVPAAGTLSEELADFHINLFKHIDTISAPKFRSHILFDGKKHFEFLQEAYTVKSNELFIQYIAWVHSLFSSLNFLKISLIRFLVSMRYIIQTKGGETWQDGIPYLDLAIQHLTGKNDSYQQDCNAELMPEASAYLQFLLNGNRKEAQALVFELLNKGMPVKNIYLRIFQDSQYEVGRLWERSQITVAQEHFCTASTQLIMSQLYPYIVSDKPVSKNVIATCIGEELHELGIRIVSDFLEMEGWQTYYLGANAPPAAILSAIDQNKAQVLALSVTLSPHLKQARKLIEEVRSNAKWPVKIIVGGYPFLQDKELWKKIGADTCAESAQTAHEKISELFNMS